MGQEKKITKAGKRRLKIVFRELTIGMHIFQKLN